MRVTPCLGIAASLQFGIGSAYDCHVYAICTRDGIVLIDSGCGGAATDILGELSTDFPSVPLKAIVLTHAHVDHFGGAAHLQRLGAVQVFASDCSRPVVLSGDETACGLTEARQMGIYPQDLRLSACRHVETFSDGQPFDVLGHTFHPIRVRGHSDDSHCLLTEVSGKRCVFTGDTIFYGGILGVINRPDSGMQGYRCDIKKLSNLNVEGLFPGHGLFTLRRGQAHIDLAIEQAHKGFLPRQIGQWDILF